MKRFVFGLVLAALPLATTACSDVPAAERKPAIVGSGTAELRSIRLHVPDMACGLCARPIERRLEALGLREVKADLETKWVTGRYDPARLTPDSIRSSVEELKFRVAEVRDG